MVDLASQEYTDHLLHYTKIFAFSLVVGSRVMLLFHDLVSLVVREDGLGEVWTADRALEYLLLAGLLPEAVWFARALGDWKAAFILGVVCERHVHRYASAYLKSTYKR